MEQTVKTEGITEERICQGDIFKDVEFIEYATEKSGTVEISKIIFPFVIVLSQDCDLQQDFNARKCAHNVMFARNKPKSDLKQGTAYFYKKNEKWFFCLLPNGNGGKDAFYIEVRANENQRDLEEISNTYATAGKKNDEAKKQLLEIVTSNYDNKNNQDKYLISVIVTPLYNIEHVRLGEHLSGIDLKMSPISKSKNAASDALLQNQKPRYHYLKFANKEPIPDSVIDFKHYFSINVGILLSMKEKNYCIRRVSALYRERLSQRFANFLSRIGLPE